MVFGSTTSTQDFTMQITFPAYTNPSSNLNTQRMGRLRYSLSTRWLLFSILVLTSGNDHTYESQNTNKVES